MKIHLATDHAGFALKNELIPFMEGLGHEIEDQGAFELNEGDDYPIFVQKAAEAVSNDPENTRAIILGWSGQGEAMCANRFPHVRAAVYYGGPLAIIELSRAHNDANVLSLGVHFLTTEEAKTVVEQWLNLPFSNEERHVRRITMLD